MTLPKSLKKQYRIAVLKRVLFCLLLIGLAVLTRVESDKALAKQGIYAAITVDIILLVLPFAISGVPLKLIDAAWSGEVTAVQVKERIGSYTMGGKIRPDTRHDLILTVATDDGREIKYTALSHGVKNSQFPNIPNIGKIEYHISRYQVGDRVHKFRGFSHLYVERTTEVSPKHCVVCGTVNTPDQGQCWSCHAELIE